jgi:hypothetical protein
VQAGTEPIRIENSGRMDIRARGAGIRCFGETTIRHPEFTIRSQGQLMVFFSASLRIAAPGAPPETLEADPQLVSIVAIGNVEVERVQDGHVVIAKGTKAVYQARQRRWLVDDGTSGREAPAGTSPPARRQSTHPPAHTPIRSFSGSVSNDSPRSRDARAATRRCDQSEPGSTGGILLLADHGESSENHRAAVKEPPG